jgi:hypothetical protein
MVPDEAAFDQARHVLLSAKMSLVTLPALHRDALHAHSRKIFATGVYLLWLAMTWLLEKRVGLFMRHDPAGRTLYALLANVLIGTLLAGAVLAAGVALGTHGRGAGSSSSLPWRARPFVLAFTLVAGGAIAIRATPPAARDTIVIVNAFAQILPTSIAEVVTCWLLVGGAVQASAMRLGRVPAILLGIAGADFAFAFYHIAHSAPFDRPEMMAFLMLPGLVTGGLVFVVRDRAVAILAQNLFALIGVTKNADASVFRHPFLWAYAVAIVAAAAAFLTLRWSDRAVNGSALRASL